MEHIFRRDQRYILDLKVSKIIVFGFCNELMKDFDKKNVICRLYADIQKFTFCN